jgi:membrane fusion protein (multidrug efflux system)
VRLALVASSASLLVGGVVLFTSAPEPRPVSAAGEGAALRRVRTWRVAAVPVASRVEVSGVLEARRTVQIFSETRGPVQAVGAEELDAVEAGQVLLEVDPLLAQVAVERAEATLQRSESELALARSNLARRRSLTSRGVTSDADLDDAVNAEKVAAAALRQSRAELTRSRDELAKKTVAAPFAGVLRSFPVEVGEYVSEGQQLAELLDLAAARLLIGLSDREVVAVRPGQQAEVFVEAYGGERFAGSVLRVGAASDPETRKFPVEVEIANPDRRLLPGMVVRAGLELGAAVPRRLIPRDATVDEFGLRLVFVVVEDPDTGRVVARRRRVEVRDLPFRPGEFEVVDGLADGEEIALTGVRQLRDGEAVRREHGAGS